MKMFLRAYGIPISDWPYNPPSRPYYQAKTVPLPDQVNQIIYFKYSTDSYENALLQYLLTHNFVIGWRRLSINTQKIVCTWDQTANHS
jgi:hypothetical protein